MEQVFQIAPWPRHDNVFTKYGADTRAVPPEDNCLFLKDGKPLISRQDIHLVAARPKAGKTSFTWALVEAAVKGEALGFKAVEEGLRCLLCDSEMSEADVARKCQSLESATGIPVHNSPDDRVRVLRLRRPGKDDAEAAKLTPNEWRFQCLEEALFMEHFDLIVIDGCHDFCGDVMDNAASIECSRRLQGLAEQYDCAVLCVLHLNPKGAGETRGHLGSQLQRDCSDFFRLERRTDAAGVQYVHVSHELESRHQQANPSDFIFSENGEALPYQPVSPMATEAEQLRETLGDLFTDQKELSSAEIREALIPEGGGRATGFRKIQRAVSLGLLTPTRKGFYALTAIEDFKDIQSLDIDDVL